MHFSPLVLLRQPTYTLNHLDAFAIDLSDREVTPEAIEALRKKFLSLIQSKHLLLSLPFSSKTVYNAIAHYEFHAAVKIRKKEKQSERAFMKYLQRMALNCSPLADFAGSQFSDWSGKNRSAKNKFRLELALAQRKEFFDLCYCDQGLQGIMRHRLNPSLRFEGDGFAYIFKGPEGEELIRIETSPEFEKLFNSFKAVDFTFAEFVSQSDFDVNDFLEAQLITPSYPTYLNIAIVFKIVDAINNKYGLSFSTDDITGRDYTTLDDKTVLTLQTEWISNIKAYAKKLNVNLNDKIYSERVFYLNTALNNGIKPNFDRELISEELLRLVSLIQSSQIQEEQVSSYDNLHEVIEYSAIQYQYDKVQVQTEDNSPLLKLELRDMLGKDITRYNNAIGVLLHHTSDKKPILVNVTTAYGKFFAPALPLASEEVKDLVKKWVAAHGENKVILKDSSLHSKNKAHAFLKEFDNFGLDFHTPISERIRADWVEGKLQEETGDQKIDIVNLGIEDVESRSPLYRNLIQLIASLPNIPKFMEGLQEIHQTQLSNGISLQPRIESGHLTLALQSWIISELNHFPVFVGELHTDMMVLNGWRQELDIPRIVSFSFDRKKSNYLDFYNPWSVDIFLRSIKNMESNCKINELGIPEKIKGIQLVETYFEFKPTI